jgi:hypothetical protein
MNERSGNPDLAQKPLRTDRPRETGVEDLDRYPTIVLGIEGEIDPPHATSSNLAEDGVRITEVWQRL